MIGPYQNALVNHFVFFENHDLVVATFPPLPDVTLSRVLASSSDWFVGILVEVVFIISQNSVVLGQTANLVIVSAS